MESIEHTRNKCDVFTPDGISKIMSNYLPNNGGNLLEPSVGNGQLLKYIKLDTYTEIDVYDITPLYLEQCVTAPNIQKHCEDFIMAEIPKKFKNIIMNPPFIKFQDLPIETRKYIKATWTQLKSGNIDIYCAFLLKCLDLLEPDGTMVAITPNSFLYNKSATKLREYFVENRYIDTIIDYKSNKVFTGVSTYCCITIFTKKPKTHITYIEENITTRQIMYEHISGPEFNIFTQTVPTNTQKIGDICTIRNGIATLRDKIYIHATKLYDEPCWKPITNASIKQWIIYPYTGDGEILDEEVFKTSNPQTYKYLESNRDELAKRDKGNKQYPKWYSFGRTQSLKIPKTDKIAYIPTFVHPSNINIQIDDPVLHIGCLSIEANDSRDLPAICEAIKNNMEFITNNSSKRGGGWINLSGRILGEVCFAKPMQTNETV
jgi:adenine-specific DNA-methyltransferase